MKAISNTLILVLMSFTTTVVNAECREDLSYEQVVDCIVVEGAGQSWESYQHEQDEITTRIIEEDKAPQLASIGSKSAK